MQLTNKQLKQLIKEEVQNILIEDQELARAIEALRAKSAGAKAGEHAARIGSRLNRTLRGTGEELGKGIGLSVRLAMIEKRLDKLEGAGT